MRGRLPGPAALRLWRTWREFRPDIVQGWMYHGNTAASLVGWLQLAATPVFWTVHYSLDQAIAPNRLTRWLVRAGAPLSRTVARIVYCSAASAGQHEALGYDPRRRVVSLTASMSIASGPTRRPVPACARCWECSRTYLWSAPSRATIQ